MFTKKCFIRKNTPELMEKLEMIGYSHGHVNRHDSYLMAREIAGFAHYDTFHHNDMNMVRCTIDCETNEELFLAIAALRDDSDYMQWMTDGSHWCYGDKFGSNEHLIKYYHKATVPELIKHFSK